MARARIGKLFHLTPLVDSLPDAEYFFNTVFSPLCMMRNYSSHWHRHAAIYIIGETSIEPMHCLPPEPGDEATSWYRYAERFGPRVHNMAFYVDDLDDLAERLQAAGVRITDAGSGTTVFCHPKDTPGMLEFHPATGGLVGADSTPASAPSGTRSADAYWSQHPLGLHAHVAHHRRDRRPRCAPRSSTSTCSTPGAAPRPGRDRRRRTVAPLPRGRGHRRRDDGPGRHRHRSPPATSSGSGRRSPA